MFAEQYKDIWHKNPKWNAIATSEGELYEWDPDSTYIQEPPFLENLATQPSPIQPIYGARCLAALGDSVTTDHISPAGSIAKDSPAGKYLMSLGVEPRDFNSYGARRGNDRVMTRGTFANIRIRNLLAPGTEGGVTRHLPDGEVMSIYDAAVKYKAEGLPLLVMAGAEYGSGSSRDWAAKGPFLQGVRAVLAVSYERIHRSNLVMMGILPLEFPPNTTWQSLGLTGEEVFDIPGLNDSLRPQQQLTVVAAHPNGVTQEFPATVRIDTPVELDYYRNGGILQTVLRKLLRS
jgi:aconitate hydratase